MKYAFFTFILICTSCYQPERNCSDFKIGVFKYEALVNGKLESTIFKRNEYYQVEIYKGKTDTSAIRWINNCEFILTPIHPKSILEQYQIHMKIISTTDQTYQFQYNIVGETQKEIGIAERIK